MSHWIRTAGSLSVLLLASIAACSSRDNGFEQEGSQFVQDAGGDEAAPPTCGGQRCSRDLHAVIDDCTETVIRQCPDDQGCAAGACVPACDSAKVAQGSIGCSFFAIPPDTLPLSESSCYTVFIANTWNTPVHVTAEFGGQPLDISKSVYRASSQNGGGVTYERIDEIPPRGLGIVFLSQGDPAPTAKNHVDCPAGVQVAVHQTVVKEHATSIYPAFHLTTDTPVSAYSLFPYGGAKSFLPSATLLLPTSSWDTNYILVDGWGTYVSPPFVQIVAQEDNTEVRIRPSVDILDGVNVNGGIRGAVTSWTLSRGQVLELTQPKSLAGSPIETSHPVAVFGGTQCSDVPDASAACDSLHQQIPPIHEWSSSYSGVPYKSRRVAVGENPPEQVYWRVVGAADGTELTYDPAMPLGAPTTLSSGQVVSFVSEFPFKVKSQDTNHPFYLAVYMSGSTVYHTLGDPDFVNVIPDEQFLDHYVFFLDYTYSDSNLTFVRRKDATGFHDVTLDCTGPITGWQPVGTDGTTEYAWVDMTRGHAPVGSCSYGRHEAQSDGPFGLYVWGLDHGRELRLPRRRRQPPHVSVFGHRALTRRQSAPPSRRKRLTLRHRFVPCGRRIVPRAG